MNKARLRKICCLGVLFVSVSSGAALADSDGLLMRFTSGGAHDTSFNGTGSFIATTSGYDEVRDVAITSNGKIVTCGTFTNGNGQRQILVGRFNSNGSADTSFGWLGVTTAAWPGSAFTNGCAIDSSGRILLTASEQAGRSLVVRFLSNGALDGSFGLAGYIIQTFGTGIVAEPKDITVAPDGKIVVVGSHWNSGGGDDPDCLVLRYTSSGFNDTSFSGDGIAITDLGGWDQAQTVAVDSSSRVVVSVDSGPGAASGSSTVLRYTSSGSLDTSFSGDGKRAISFPGYSNEGIASVVVDGSGRIVLGGTAYNSDPRVAVARLTAAGAYDTSFSSDGRRVTNYGVAAIGNAMQLDDNGKLVVAGLRQVDEDTFEVIAIRFLSNGNLDTGFSSDGKAAWSFAPSPAEGLGIAIDSSNRPVVVGHTLF